MNSLVDTDKQRQAEVALAQVKARQQVNPSPVPAENIIFWSAVVAGAIGFGFLARKAGASPVVACGVAVVGLPVTWVITLFVPGAHS